LPEEIDFILHTHGHFDHFEGDELFPNAKIFMAEPDAVQLKNKNTAFTHITHPESFHPKINFLLKENQLIQLSPFSLKTIFTPGHSKGSVCFYEEKHKWLFSGDTLFFHSIGRTDLPSGSFAELKNSIQMLSKLEIEFLFPGHGKIVSGIKENKENFDYINKAFF
jgi:glyoxylase-like metal-dependent hydrolase (beta-lactamase superfamily II)